MAKTKTLISSLLSRLDWVSMKRLAVLALALILAIAVAAQVTYAIIVRVTVIGPDGKPLANAKVSLIAPDGKEYSNTTDSSGATIIDVPANGTYLVKVSAGSIILDSVDVAGTTNKTVNASLMHYVNLTSTPISVDVDVMLLTCNISTKITTNSTVYASASLNITYPKEVVRFPYKYVFSKIRYDGHETNETSIVLDMAADHVVTAYYEQTLAYVLPPYLALALAVIVVLAILAAWMAGARTAKSIIAERTRRFVNKVR